jgi:hypothetical protein
LESASERIDRHECAGENSAVFVIAEVSRCRRLATPPQLLFTTVTQLIMAWHRKFDNGLVGASGGISVGDPENRVESAGSSSV